MLKKVRIIFFETTSENWFRVYLTRLQSFRKFWKKSDHGVDRMQHERHFTPRCERLRKGRDPKRSTKIWFRLLDGASQTFKLPTYIFGPNINAYHNYTMFWKGIRKYEPFFLVLKEGARHKTRRERVQSAISWKKKVHFFARRVYQTNGTFRRRQRN